LRNSRSRGKSVLAVIGSCLAVYAVFAVVFHSFIAPTVKSQAVAPYEPSARNTQPSATAFAVRSEPAQRVTAKQRTSPTITTTQAGPETTGSVRAQAPRANPFLSTPSRIAPPMMVTAAPPQPAETAGSGQSSLGAPERSTSVAAAAPESTAATPKKPVKKVARKTPRYEQPRRDFWTNFFAWGSENGARPSY
jgi:hypothetical protein